jgi:F0F1-type ATP synthase, alpha subunit
MVSDGIVRIHGLADAMYGEMIEFDGGLFGMALNLEQDSVGAVVLGNYLSLQEGQKARCTGRVLEVPVGPELLGRVSTLWVTQLMVKALLMQNLLMLLKK